MAEELRRVDTSLGPIEYFLTVKSIKNINLRIRGDGTVAVSVPRRVSKARADDFVRSRAAWVMEHQRRRSELGIPLAPPEKREALPVLATALERVYPLTVPLGVKKPVLKVRFMTSRWGSCHWTKGIITLNTALAAVEGELQDYVALHELVHFLHPNHGPGFYAVMDALMPDWQTRRRALRRYTLERPV
ncbi:M48 family metallopeptidase [Intestinimonas timonensis]|uniref:M48 family metallopeptidase n=1 Tax=Intestinimonas timonensis TaxID=1689270 RepID=UPI003A903547